MDGGVEACGIVYAHAYAAARGERAKEPNIAQHEAAAAVRHFLTTIKDIEAQERAEWSGGKA